MRQFYTPQTTGDPPILWTFREEILPNGYCMEQEVTPTGDPCHYNIVGIPDNALKRILKTTRCEDYRVDAYPVDPTEFNIL